MSPNSDRKMQLTYGKPGDNDPSVNGYETPGSATSYDLHKKVPRIRLTLKVDEAYQLQGILDIWAHKLEKVAPDEAEFCQKLVDILDEKMEAVSYE